MWIEQAGKGGKRKIGRLTALTPSAPPLRHHTKHLVVQLNLSGGALGMTKARRPSFRLPSSQLVRTTEVLIPSLFNPLWKSTQKRP